MSAVDSFLSLIKNCLIRNGECRNLPFSLILNKMESAKVHLFDEEKNKVTADILNLKNKELKSMHQSINIHSTYSL